MFSDLEFNSWDIRPCRSLRPSTAIDSEYVMGILYVKIDRLKIEETNPGYTILRGRKKAMGSSISMFSAALFAKNEAPSFFHTYVRGLMLGQWEPHWDSGAEINSMNWGSIISSKVISTFPIVILRSSTTHLLSAICTRGKEMQKHCIDSICILRLSFYNESALVRIPQPKSHERRSWQRHVLLSGRFVFSVTMT